MKHIFIINPKAGGKDSSFKIIKLVEQYQDKIDCEIYLTKGVYDAYNYVKEFCENNQGKLRFYACGGDGTLNEVVNGVIGYPNVSVTNYPSGSGNDFIKNFDIRDQFADLDKLINGKEKLIDVLKVNDRYVVNICNFGFDATVSENFVKFRKKPFVKGKGAYSLAVFYSLLFKMKYKCKLEVDNIVFHDGEMLLCALANGFCYGGGFKCAPDAKVNDGLMDIVLAEKLSRLKFIKMVGKYKKGLHLQDPKVSKYIKNIRGKKVKIMSVDDIVYTIDGENLKSKEINIEVVEKAIKFVIP